MTERPARGMYLCRAPLSDAGAVLKATDFQKNRLTFQARK